MAVHRYPVDVATRTQLIDLLQQVFSRSDVDWLQSMRGIYSDVLTTCQLVGHLEGFPVGSATVAFAVDQPEVCVIEDVMTLPAARGQGIARALTEQVVKIGFDAGCRLAYLGNAPTVSSVYEHVDFTRIRGVFMRREAPGCAGHETRIFTPGQAMDVRETNWGDLPGVVCLMAQPTGRCAPYPTSRRSSTLLRMEAVACGRLLGRRCPVACLVLRRWCLDRVRCAMPRHVVILRVTIISRLVLRDCWK